MSSRSAPAIPSHPSARPSPSSPAPAAPTAPPRRGGLTSKLLFPDDDPAEPALVSPSTSPAALRLVKQPSYASDPAPPPPARPVAPPKQPLPAPAPSQPAQSRPPPPPRDPQPQPPQPPPQQPQEPFHAPQQQQHPAPPPPRMSGYPPNLEAMMHDLQDRVTYALHDQDRRLQRIEHMMQGIMDAQDALARTFRMSEVLARQTQFEQDLQRSQLALQQALETQRNLTARLPELGTYSASLGAAASMHSGRSEAGAYQAGPAPAGAKGGAPPPSSSGASTYSYSMGEKPRDRVADRPPPPGAHPADNRSAYPADNRSAYPADNRSAYPTDNRSAYPADNRSAYPADSRSAYPADNRTTSDASMGDRRTSAYDAGAPSTPVHGTATSGRGYVPRPTVVGVPAREFQPDKDAPAIKKALSGWSADAKRIVGILGNRNNAQRQQIADSYEKTFSKKLKDDLSKVGGNVGACLQRLMLTPAQFDAAELQAAMKGLGTDDSALIEILCTRTPAQITLIKDAFQTAYKKDLVAEVTSETSGDYRKMLLELLKGDRDADIAADVAKAKADAAALYKAGEDTIGTDEKVFIDILSKRSFTQLQIIADEYSKIADYDLEKSIKREMSFNLKKALVAIITVCRNPAEYFAERLEYSMKGLGFNERMLTRVIISRCEIDLENVKQAYYAKYKRNLEAALKSETKGDYRTLLYALIGTDKGFNPEEDAKTLKRAFKGVGSDNEAILNLLGRRYVDQRIAIAKAYESAYGKSLEKEIQGEIISPTSADFAKMLQLMLYSPAQLDAWTVKKCIDGVGTDSDSLIEVLCTRTNQEIKAMGEAYQQMYKSTMTSDIEREWMVSGDFGKVIKELLKGDRDESDKVNIEQARKDAGVLYKAGEDKLGTDEKAFIDILTKRNYVHLRAVCDEYAKISDNDLEKAITKEMSFNLKKALVAIVKVTRNAPEYFAERLYKSMKGVGTNDDMLIRIVISRAEIDMAEIRTAFSDKYKTTLEKFIQGDTSGAYRRLLFKLIEFSSGASNI